MIKQIIEKLEKEHGDSFFIFDEASYVKNLQEVKTAFEKHYNNVTLAYSFKTNYIPRIGQLALEQNVLAEVVSEMEYELALRIGYPPDKIIFNGPIKNPGILFEAFANDSIVHFDSEKEIDYLEEYLADSPGKSVRCAVRCNFDLRGEATSRFGFDAETDEIERVYERLFKIEGCKPIGIHCHFSTSTRSLDSYLERTRKIISVAKKVFSGRNLEYIDIGGGFFGKMPDELIQKFPVKVPGYDEYAAVIGKDLLKAFPGENINLILEPGTMVVADTVKFYCKVNNIKFIRDKEFVIVHGSIHNTKPTGKSKIQPSSRVIPMDQGQKQTLNNADITGYTCIEEDILTFAFKGEIAVGDFIEFSNVGAYSIMYKPPFIKGQPPILSKRDDRYSVIKKRETIDDIFSTYIF